MGQNERNKFYYDMLDEAEKIDSVVHDLIGTLNEEDLDKGIFVGKKENGEHVEQEFHLVAKDMKKTVVDLLGSANENEIVVGGPEQTLKGSDVYFNKQDDIDTVTEIFNTSDVILDTNDSYMKFTPTEFHFTYKTTIDEQTNKEAPKDGSRLHLTPNSTYIGGDSALGASFFLSQSSDFCNFTSKKVENERNFITYQLMLSEDTVAASCSENTRMAIGPSFIVLNSGTADKCATLYMSDTAKLSCRETSNVNIYGSSRTNIYGSAQITARDSSQTFMLGSARTEFSDSAKTTMTGTSWTVIGGNSRIAVDGSARLTIHGAPAIDITGESVYNSSTGFWTEGQGQYENPNIFIHDFVYINIDNGKNNNVHGGYNYTYTQAQTDCKGRWPYGLHSIDYRHRYAATILIHDFPCIEISQMAWIHCAGTSFFGMEGHSTLSLKDNALIEMQNDAMLEIKDTSGLMLEEGSIFHMKTYEEKKPPRAFMCGPCYFSMQTYDSQQAGPAFVVEDKALYYLGDGYVPSNSNTSMDGRWRGVTGWGELISDRLNSNSLTTVKDYWGEDVLVYDFHNIKGSSNKLIPCVKIGGNITLNLDTSSPNGVYIKVGNPTNSKYDDYRINVFLEGDTFIRTGEHNKIDLNGGWFQTTGNPHTEIHNNTRFIFRGNLTEPVPWLDGLKFETVKKGTNGETYEWESFNSSRHVKPADSPVAQMYDSSNFCMRGVWKVPEEFEKTVTLTITKDDHSSIYDTLKDKTGPIQVTEVHPGLDEDLKKVYAAKPYDSSDTRGFCVESEDGTKEYVPNSFMEEISSVKSIGSVEKDKKGNIILKEVKISVKPKKPAKWNDRAIKEPNNPLLEVIENAEVRIRGNVYIDISDEGISIGKVGEANQETELFKFTVEDIKTVYEAVKSGNLSTEAKPMAYQVKENINVAGDSYVDTVVENVKTAESIVCTIPEDGFTELDDDWFVQHTVEMPETTSETSSDS